MRVLRDRTTKGSSLVPSSMPSSLCTCRSWIFTCKHCLIYSRFYGRIVGAPKYLAKLCWSKTLRLNAIMQSQRKFTTLKQSCRTFAKKCNLALNWQTIIVQKISSTHCNISSTVIHEWLLYFSRVEGKTFPSMGFGINYGPWCCHLSIQAASSHQETNSGHIFPRAIPNPTLSHPQPNHPLFPLFRDKVVYPRWPQRPL